MTEVEIENAMSKTGWVVAGASEAEGEDRAAQAAIVPLLADGSIKQASGIMVEIVGDNLTDGEASAAAETVHQACGPDTETLFWVLHDGEMAGAVRVTVIGLDS
jgi:cell division GTPase FtsZ